MPKILLSAVGKRDPFAAFNGQITDGPLLSVCSRIKPDIIILFPSQKQFDEKLSDTEDNADKSIEEFKKRYPEVKCIKRPLNLPDPTHYNRIIRLLLEETNQIRQKYAASSPEYFVNLSSGTPQIQASFLVLINSKRINARVFQSIDPKFVKEDESRIHEIDTQFLEEENFIRRAEMFMEKLNFSAAADELLELGAYTIYPERSVKAEVFADILYAYHYWDLYQHEEALKRLRQIQTKVDQFKINDIKAEIKKQIGTLQNIINLKFIEGQENLLDLYHNAQRCETAHRYIDCLNRFKRLHEGCYFYIARKELGIPKPNETINRQPEWVQEILTNKSSHLNTYDISTLYSNKKHTSIVKESLGNDLASLSTKRNYTVNNHGMMSVNQSDARKAINTIKKLLERTFPDVNIDDYAFSLQSIKNIKQLLFMQL